MAYTRLSPYKGNDDRGECGEKAKGYFSRPDLPELTFADRKHGSLLTYNGLHMLLCIVIGISMLELI